MNSSAHVSSLQALVKFRAELLRFEQAVRQILDEQSLEVQKASDYVEHDRTHYWPRALKQAEDKVVAAREALSRSKLATLDNENKSHYQEKEVLEKAVTRQRHCEHQLRQLRHWRIVMRKQTEDYQTRRARLVHYLDTDIPKAVAALERILQVLEKYAELNPNTDVDRSNP
jgi:predicted  nucleic acid-binding Zn-ribbon protein